MESIQAKKSKLRTTMLLERRSLSPAAIAAESALIAKKLLAWQPYAAVGTVLAFAAMPDEPQTAFIMQDALQQGKKLCLPRIDGSYGSMAAAEVHSLAELVEGKYGILAPPPEKAVIDPGCIELIIVPGVAFTLTGQRLGLGAGFYDRFLAQAGQAVRIGLALQCQIAASIPCEDHDYLVDHLATHAGIINCQTGKM